MQVKARLVVDDVEAKKTVADLYLPLEEWKKLVKQLGNNKLTVALRFEGEDGTS